LEHSRRYRNHHQAGTNIIISTALVNLISRNLSRIIRGGVGDKEMDKNSSELRKDRQEASRGHRKTPRRSGTGSVARLGRPAWAHQAAGPPSRGGLQPNSSSYFGPCSSRFWSNSRGSLHWTIKEGTNPPEGTSRDPKEKPNSDFQPLASSRSRA
jgi:hypothetical protein